MCHEPFVYQIMKLLMPLFIVVFLQLDSFPVELPIPWFLTQLVLARIGAPGPTLLCLGVPVPSLVVISVTIIPAFLNLRIAAIRWIMTSCSLPILGVVAVVVTGLMICVTALGVSTAAMRKNDCIERQEY